jgi:hypothetical protein
VSTWLPLVGCVAVSLPRFLLDSTDSIQRATVPWAVALTVWWCLPLVWLLRTARSTVVARGGSAAYVVFAGFSLAATYRNTHSTAAFGIVFWPPYLAAGIAVLLGVEALVFRHQRRGRLGDSPEDRRR